MTPIILAALCASAALGAEPVSPPDAPGLSSAYEEPDTWGNRANFYVGARGGVAIPAGALGVAPSGGFELGVANSFGFGFGLHAMWMQHTAGAPLLGIPPTSWGLGAMLDTRFYFPTLAPLTLYPNISLGFLAGPGQEDGRNVVLPMLNPGFGARVQFSNFYANFEFGLANFTVPYVSLALGYQGDRARDRRRAWDRSQAELAQREAQEQREEKQRETRRPKAPAREVQSEDAERNEAPHGETQQKETQQREASQKEAQQKQAPRKEIQREETQQKKWTPVDTWDK